MRVKFLIKLYIFNKAKPHINVKNTEMFELTTTYLNSSYTTPKKHCYAITKSYLTKNLVESVFKKK